MYLAEKYIIILNEVEISLPKKEFELLNLLASNLGKVFVRDDIFARIWGEEIIVGERTIDVHVWKLKEKLGDELIQTIKGVGYKLNPK